MRSRAAVMAIATLSALALAAFLAGPGSSHPAGSRTRTDPRQLLNKNPADWMAASAVTEAALDSSSPARFQLWRKAHAHARRLAPWRLAPEIAFVRSGLFHWYELPAEDRAAVLRAAGPLLHDPPTFSELHRPLFELTGDFTLLRKENPGNAAALNDLQALAAMNGLFDDYRFFRQALKQRQFADFAAIRKTLTAAEIGGFLPANPDHDDEPLILSALNELHERPLETAPVLSLDSMVNYALGHELRPLDGLAFLTDLNGMDAPLRARLALRLNEVEKATKIEIAESKPGQAVWQQYHVERAIADARRGDQSAAQLHLMKASATGLTPMLLAAAAEIGPVSNDVSSLLESSATVKWSGLCGPDVCTSATASVYLKSPQDIALRIEAIQSDEYPPYVELFADDKRVAEGPVGTGTTMTTHLDKKGLHRLRLLLVNPRTRNLMQRRVRIAL